MSSHSTSSNHLDLIPEDISFTADPELLHKYAALGSKENCMLLLQHGYPWNAIVDSQSIGEVALAHGHTELYSEFVQFGVRAEFILKALGQRVVEDGDLTNDLDSAANSGYLSRKLHYSDDGTMLLDSDKNAVMMGWETPIMKLSVDALQVTGKRVLNVGFGLGIIDRIIQDQNPSSHTIIEAHPDVYKYMLDHGWDKKAKILFGRWQDITEFELYDCVYFDTFGEYYDDLVDFHELLPNILDEEGTYSFFNGLGGTNQFFHDVYCEIAELDLRDKGFDVIYKKFPVDQLGDDVWRETKRAYWSLPEYSLPIVTFSHQ